MAKTVSEQEIQLRKRARRRLVGAITLAIGAIVILPMVLDTKPEQRSHEIDIRIPSEDSVEELDPDSASLQEPASLIEGTTAPEKPVTVAPEKPAAKTMQGKPAAPRSALTVAPPANEPGSRTATEGKNASAGAGVYVVQLGAFSEPAKANQQIQKLASMNIAAYTKALKSEKGEITRVRVGPFANREEAERTREKLTELGFPGVVTEK
jgi:DedD protein